MTEAQAMLQEMQQLENTLLHTDFAADKAALERLLADDFEEVSPHGQVTSRTAVLQWLLRKDAEHRWQFRDWQVTALAPTVRVVRYHAVQVMPASGSQGALHVSLWVLDASLQCWRLRFHQSVRVG